MFNDLNLLSSRQPLHQQNEEQETRQITHPFLLGSAMGTLSKTIYGPLYTRGEKL